MPQVGHLLFASGTLFTQRGGGGSILGSSWKLSSVGAKAESAGTTWSGREEQ